MKTKFSIIVPIYKVEDYIHQCITSVLTQSYDNYELILVDDGSPDKCPEICDEFQNKDSRIVVIHKENGGSSEARNVGIEKASGDYLLFLDGDDYWLETNLLEVLNAKINQFDSDVICLNYKKVYETKMESKYLSLDEDMSNENRGKASVYFIAQNNIWTASAWSKVVKRSLFFKGNLWFIRGITSEDIDWCARLAILAETFDYVERPYVGYRQRKNSISKGITFDKVCCLRDNIFRVERIIEKADAEKKQLLNGYLSYQYGTLLKNAALLQSLNQRKKICKEIKHLRRFLGYSKNNKIKILRCVTSIIGITGTVEIIHLVECIK